MYIHIMYVVALIIKNYDIIFIQNDIADILNGFVIDLQVTTAEFVQSATDGNVDPVDLSAFPVLDIVGPSHVRVGR